MSAKVSNRLLDALNGREFKARQEAMLAAWRTWRNAIIRAMAVQLEKDPIDEDEIGALQVEMGHASLVLESLLPNADEAILNPDPEA